MWLPPTYRAVVVGSWPGIAWLFKPNKFCLLIVRKTIGVDWTFVVLFFFFSLPPPRAQNDGILGNSWLFPCTIFHQHRWTQPPCCFTESLTVSTTMYGAMSPHRCSLASTWCSHWDPLWLSPSQPHHLSLPLWAATAYWSDPAVSSRKAGEDTKRVQLPRCLFKSALLFPT